MKSFPEKNMGMPMKAINLSLLIVLSIPAFAQKSDDSSNNLLPKNYWGFSIIPSLTAKTEIDGDKNRYQLHSHPKFGAELLIHYHINFRKNYALVFSIGKNAFGSKLHYTIPKEMLDPPTGSNITPNKFGSRGMEIINYKVQAELMRRWPGNKAHNWNLGTGLSLLMSFDGGGGTTWYLVDYPSGQTKQYLTRYQQNDNNRKPWFNFHIAGGHEWTLKSKDILQINLKVNYSPINPSTGTYLFTTGVQPDLSGQYGVSGSYIGISIGYIVSRGSKKLK